MKANIHPQYFNDAQVTCSCGNTFTTGSTKQSIHVEVCSKCHPLYTGEQRFADTKGQVGKFEQRQKIAEQYSAKIKSKASSNTKVAPVKTKSLRELLMEMS